MSVCLDINFRFHGRALHNKLNYCCTPWISSRLKRSDGGKAIIDTKPFNSWQVSLLCVGFKSLSKRIHCCHSKWSFKCTFIKFLTLKNFFYWFLPSFSFVSNQLLSCLTPESGETPFQQALNRLKFNLALLKWRNVQNI